MAEVHLVARLQDRAVDPLVVHEGAVGGVEIDNFIETIGLSEQLGMETGDVVILDQDLVPGIPAE